MLVVEPLEDRSQAAVVTTQVPLVAAAPSVWAATFTTPGFATPPTITAAVNGGDLPDVTHRLTSLDLGDAGAGPLSAPRTADSTGGSGVPRHELVLVEFDVPERDELVRSLLATPDGRTVLDVIELTGGGTAEITAVLRQHPGTDAVALISHGADGALGLGTEWLDARTAGEDAADLRAWGGALNPGGAVLLYGCGVAGDAAGRGFVRQLAALTGTTVAASSDATGATALGGNWALEYATGPVTPAFVAGALADWDHTLGTTPTAASDVYQTTAGVPLTITGPGVLGNDTNPVSGAMTAVLDGGPPAHGTVSLQPDGSFTYTPDAGFDGADKFHYKAYNANGASKATDVTILVGTQKIPPQAGDDVYATPCGTTLTVTGPGVLANDLDPNGLPLTAQLQGPGPAHGTVSLQPDGSFVYTPDAGFSGTDTFQYQAADDAGKTGTAKVTILVGGSNTPPLAGNDTYVTADGTTLTVTGPGVLANDLDPNGLPLTAQLQGPGPAHGTVSLQPDGSFVYTPDAGFSGTDTFQYQAADSTGKSSTAIVSVVVGLMRRTPATSDDAYPTPAGTTLAVGGLGVLANDISPGGGSLSAQLEGHGPAHGTVTVNADGSFVYTPDPGFIGIDSFQTKTTVSGGSGSGRPWSVATVNVLVGNSAGPPLAGDDGYTVTSGTTLAVLGPGVLANDLSPEGLPLSAAVDGGGPAHGTVSVQPDGSFTYTPDPGYAGFDKFQYKASQGGAAVGETSAPAVVWILVEPQNGPVVPPPVPPAPPPPGPPPPSPGPPVANPDTYVTAAATPLTITAANGLLVNDTDPNGSPLTAALDTPPAHGTVVVHPDGSFVFTPAPDFPWTEAFTYTVTDGLGQSTTGTVTIGVITVNGPPVATPDAYTVSSSAPMEIPAVGGLLANDTDPNGSPLTAALAAPPAHGTVVVRSDGSFTYTPGGGLLADSFTYTVTDVLGRSATGTVVLAPVADTPPVVTMPPAVTILVGGTWTIDPAHTPFSVLTSGTAPGPTTLTFAVTHGTISVAALNGYTITGGANGTATVTVTRSPLSSAAATLQLAYSPANNYVGSEILTLTASDGFLSTTGTTPITVAGSPSISPVRDQVIPQDGTTNPLAFSVGDDVFPPGSLTVAASSDVPGLVPAANILLAGTGANRTVTVTPTVGVSGAATITLAVSNGLLTTTTRFTVTVVPPNRPPVPHEDTAMTSVGVAVTVPVLANDSDPDGDSLTVTGVTPGAHGSVTTDGSTTTYTPDPGFFGTDSFTYTVDDAHGGSATATVRVVVRPPPPAAEGDSWPVAADQTLVVSAPGVLANDLSPGRAQLAARLVSGPAHGVLSLNPDGSFTYTPDRGFTGTDSYTYQAVDRWGVSTPATVTLTVASLTPVPAVDTGTFTTPADTPLTLPAQLFAAGHDGWWWVGIGRPVSSADTPAESRNNPGGWVVAIHADGLSHGALDVQPDGMVIYTPDHGYVGTDSFTFVANDGTRWTEPRRVSIIVTPVTGDPRGVTVAYTVVSGQVLVVPGGVDGTPDPAGFRLTAELMTGAAHGTVSMADDGAFSYVPDDGFEGTDRFLYQIGDSRSVSALVTVTITVQPAPSDSDTPVVSGVNGAGTSSGTTPPLGAPTTGGTPGPVLTPSVLPGPDPVAVSVATTTDPTPSPLPGPGRVVNDTGRTFAVVAVGEAGPPAAPPVDAKPPAPAVAPPDAVPASSAATAPARPVTPPTAAPLTSALPAGAQVIAAELGVNAPVFAELDRSAGDVLHSARAVAATDTLVVTGLTATAGYVLLNTRAVYWLISALLARPAFWRGFDPLDVIFAWEQEKKNGPSAAEPGDDRDESLQSMVG